MQRNRTNRSANIIGREIGKSRQKQVSVRLAVSGYYGCGNAGDEAVLAGIKTAIARQAAQRGVKAELVVLSQNPDETTRLHGLPAVFRMSAKEVRRTLRDSDLLLSGGGSLLQDTTSLKSLLYYLWVMRVAISVHKPFMFYAQGIGPLRRPVSRALVRLVANRAALLTVRDDGSATLLRRIGAIKPPLEVTADPAFALDAAPSDAVDALYAAERLPRDTPLVAVALRPWHEPRPGANGNPNGPAHEESHSPVPLYARLLTELERQTGARPVLLPMHVPDDLEFGAHVAAHPDAPRNLLAVESAYPPRVLLGLIGRMQAVVALRLHTLIFAARQAVPPFALSYDPKVENLMELLGLEAQRANWRGFDPADVAAHVAVLIRDRETHTEALRARIPELERLALRTADLALNIGAKHP